MVNLLPLHRGTIYWVRLPREATAGDIQAVCDLIAGNLTRPLSLEGRRGAVIVTRHYDLEECSLAELKAHRDILDRVITHIEDDFPPEGPDLP